MSFSQSACNVHCNQLWHHHPWSHRHSLTYVTDSSDKLFLNKEAIIDLDMIPVSFPTLDVDWYTHPVDTRPYRTTPLQLVTAPGVNAQRPPNCYFLHPKTTARSCNNVSMTTTGPAHSTRVNIYLCLS